MSQWATRNEGVGERLRRLRLARGLTQRELAGSKYSPAYVSTIEAGRRTPSPAAARHFAIVLGVEIEEIVSGRPPDLAARLMLRIQEAGAALAAGRHDDAETRFRAVAEDARQYGLARIEARAHEGLGLAAERSGRAAEALEHFERADRVLESEPPPVRVEAICGIARCLQMMGDIRYAIHVLETFQLTLREEQLEDPAAMMRTYSSLVWPYSEAGLHHKAAEAADEALKLQSRVDDAEKVAGMHLNVARVLLRQGRPDDALESLRSAERIYRLLERRIEVARAHLARGIVLSKHGSVDDARRELRTAVDMIEGTSDRLNHARALNELAKVERRAGHRDVAASLLQRSLSILGDGDVTELALAHRELGLCLVEQDATVAEKHFRTAIELYARADEPQQAAATYAALGDLLSARGELDAARETYREGVIAIAGRA